MKKFTFTTITATLLLLSVWIQPQKANAASFTIQSFLNPGVSALVISNGIMGATNSAYIAQNVLQGVYQLGTNTAGTSINAAIATNYALPSSYYSNATPVVWFGQQFPGSLVILTNAAAAAAGSTNDVIFSTQQTNFFNYFNDVSLPQDFYNGLTTDAGLQGAAGSTNSIGYIQIVTSPWSLFGYAVGAGSNIVNFAFSPIAAITSPNPGNGAPIAGWTPDLEPSFNDSLWTVTYTNQISRVGAPTVFVAPVPRWPFPTKGMRLRWAYTGTSTNAVCINSITYHSWIP